MGELVGPGDNGLVNGPLRSVTEWNVHKSGGPVYAGEEGDAQSLAASLELVGPTSLVVNEVGMESKENSLGLHCSGPGVWA